MSSNPSSLAGAARHWRKSLVSHSLALALGATIALASGAAQAAGEMDFLFGTSAQPPVSSNGRTQVWKVAEFSAIRLVPREAGAPANAHPAQADAEALRAALQGVSATLGSGTSAKTGPLFAAGELAEIVPALSAALAAAGPDEDLLLLSTSRRTDGFLSTPLSASARLFMADGRLQIIVQEARADVYGIFRGTKVLPTLKFGSRNADSGQSVRGPAGSQRRGDWLALDLRSVVVRPVVMADPNSAVPAAMAPAAAAPAPAAPAVRDNAFFEQQELRLKTLKRLRDQGLITEQEYEEKRRAIVNSL